MASILSFSKRLYCNGHNDVGGGDVILGVYDITKLLLSTSFGGFLVVRQCETVVRQPSHTPPLDLRAIHDPSSLQNVCPKLGAACDMEELPRPLAGGPCRAPTGP